MRRSKTNNRLFITIRFLIFGIIFIIQSKSAAQVEGKIIDICPRIGDTIDRYEKDYFGLFPEIDDFVSAQLSLRQNDSPVFKIRRTNSPDRDTLYSIQRPDVMLLIEYITNYERMIENERAKAFDPNNVTFPKKFSVLIETHIISDHPLTINDPPSLRVQASGETSSCKLIAVSDSLLIFSESEFSGDVNDKQEYKLYMLSEIDSISILKSTGFSWESAFAGLLIGGMVINALIPDGGSNSGPHPLGFLSRFALGIYFGAPCGIVTGFIGELLFKNAEELIYSSNCGGCFLHALQKLKQCSQFPEYAPPEVMRLINERTHSELR